MAEITNLRANAVHRLVRGTPHLEYSETKSAALLMVQVI